MAKEITKFSEIPHNNWAYPSYLQFHDYLKEYNLTPEDVINYVNTLYVNGRLDKDLYSKTINSLEKYEKNMQMIKVVYQEPGLKLGLLYRINQIWLNYMTSWLKI